MDLPELRVPQDRAQLVVVAYQTGLVRAVGG